MNEIYKIFDVKGKNAVVTGSSRGLGFGMAECLVKAGVNVVIANRTEEEGEKAKKTLSQYGTKVLAIPTDVSDKSSVENLVSSAMDAFGVIDILINNAAVINRGPIATMEESSWDQVIDINLKGYFLCAQAVFEQMKKNGGGKIINIASIRSRLSAGERGPYCATKGAVVMLTKSMALEWAAFNINVNAIAPGYFGTKPCLDYFAAEPEMEQKVVSGIPVGRIGIPREDLSGVTLFLASEASKYVAGETIYVDGGWSTWKD